MGWPLHILWRDDADSLFHRYRAEKDVPSSTPIGRPSGYDGRAVA